MNNYRRRGMIARRTDSARRLAAARALESPVAGWLLRVVSRSCRNWGDLLE